MARQKLILRLRQFSSGKLEREGDSHHEYSIGSSHTLEELVFEVCEVTPTPSSGSIYDVQLLRRVFQAEFRLLLASTELQDDVEYSFGLLKAFFETVEKFNTAISNWSLPSSAKNILSFEFADFADVLVEVRSKLIAKQVQSHSDTVHLAKFEYGFISALLGIIATHTTMDDVCTTSVAPQTKLVYVSEEMFSLTKKGAGFSWLDCLIPGAQSGVLRSAGQQLVGCVWKETAERLTAVIGAMQRDQDKDSLLSRLRKMADCEDLQFHSAVRGCVNHVCSHFDQLSQLALWDASFQHMLTTTASDTRKGFRPLNSTGVTCTTNQLCSAVLPPIEQCMTSTALRGEEDLNDSLTAVKHLNSLKLTRTLSAGLCSITNQMRLFVIQGLCNVLANLNLRVVSQLLFEDGPAIVSALTSSVCLSASSSSPLLLVPPSSHLHTLEWGCRARFSLLHHGCLQLKSQLEELYLVFHDVWKRKCAIVLRESFPSQKSWKRLGKKHTVGQLAPSSYCNVLIEALLLPVVEAAAGLSEGGQRSFVGVAINIFTNEFRRAIVCNTLTYTSHAGRQLLTDLRYMWKWLSSSSSKLGLCEGAVLLLSTLTALGELEHGLLVLCGTAGERRDPTTTTAAAASFTAELFHPHLPVFSELAWHSELEWSAAAGGT